MDPQLSQKLAQVTGSTAGIGFAITETLVAEMPVMAQSRARSSQEISWAA